MNSVKNLLVVVMLLGVSWGAWQVINTPDPLSESASDTEQLAGLHTGPPQQSAPTDSGFSAIPEPPISSPPRKPSPAPGTSSPLNRFRPSPADRSSSSTETAPQLTPPPLADEPQSPPGTAPTARPAASNSGGSDSIRLEGNAGDSMLSGRDPVGSNTTPERPQSRPVTGPAPNPGGQFLPETAMVPVAPRREDSPIAAPQNDSVARDSNFAMSGDRFPADSPALGAPASSPPDPGTNLTPPNTIPEFPSTGAPAFTDVSQPATETTPPGALPTAPQSPTPRDTQPSSGGVDFARIADLVNQSQFRLALMTLTSSYQKTMSAENRIQMLDWLDQLAGKVIYSTEHHLEAGPYVVQQGDTLQSIARRWNVPAQLIYKINQAVIPNPGMLEAGTPLKVVRGPFNAVVSLDRQEMTLFVQDMYAGRFPIEFGEDGAYEVTSFMIDSKSDAGQDFEGNDGRVFAADSPDNPVGRYWLGFSGSNLCIHESRNDSARGAIRVSSRDAEDIYSILSEGSQVSIIR